MTGPLWTPPRRVYARRASVDRPYRVRHLLDDRILKANHHHASHYCTDPTSLNPPYFARASYRFGAPNNLLTTVSVHAADYTHGVADAVKRVSFHLGHEPATATETRRPRLSAVVQETNPGDYPAGAETRISR